MKNQSVMFREYQKLYPIHFNQFMRTKLVFINSLLRLHNLINDVGFNDHMEWKGNGLMHLVKRETSRGIIGCTPRKIGDRRPATWITLARRRLNYRLYLNFCVFREMKNDLDFTWAQCKYMGTLRNNGKNLSRRCRQKGRRIHNWKHHWLANICMSHL